MRWIILVSVTVIAVTYFSYSISGHPPKEQALSPSPFPKVIDDKGTTRMYENGSFSITFFPSYQEYVISVRKSPFETYRQLAEQAFLQVTSLNQTQACMYNVKVVTPHFANPQLAGQQFSLSFCAKPSPAIAIPINPLLDNLYITRVHPQGDALPLGGTQNGLTLYFTHPVDLSTIQLEIVPKINLNTKTHPLNKNELYVIPNTPWTNDQTYTLTVKAGALSSDKTAQLKTDFVMSFTTQEVLPNEQLPERGI